MLELYKCYKTYSDYKKADVYFIIFEYLTDSVWECMVATKGLDSTEWMISPGRGYNKGELVEIPQKYQLIIEIFSSLKKFQNM